MTYLNFNSPDTYHNRMSRCRPPPPPLFKFSIPCGRAFTLLFKVYYPSLFCEPVFFSLFFVKSSSRCNFSDLSTLLSGNFSFQPVCQRVLNFQKICTTKSKIQKISARPEGPLPRAPPAARSNVTRCPLGTERQARTRWNALVLDNDLLHFSWALGHYFGRCSRSLDIPPRRGATLALSSCSAVKMTPSSQARPDTYGFMQTVMVNLDGHASRSVFFTIFHLGAFFWQSSHMGALLLFCGQDGSHNSGPPGCPCIHAITYGKFGWPGQQFCFHPDKLSRRFLVFARCAPRQVCSTVRNGRVRSIFALLRSAYIYICIYVYMYIYTYMMPGQSYVSPSCLMGRRRSVLI